MALFLNDAIAELIYAQDAQPVPFRLAVSDEAAWCRALADVIVDAVVDHLYDADDDDGTGAFTISASYLAAESEVHRLRSAE